MTEPIDRRVYPDTVETLAIKAHEKASEALAKQGEHERLCDERYRGIYNEMRHITDSIEGNKASVEKYQQKDEENWKAYRNSQRWLAGFVITLLISILGFMVTDRLHIIDNNQVKHERQ